MLNLLISCALVLVILVKACLHMVIFIVGISVHLPEDYIHAFLTLLFCASYFWKESHAYNKGRALVVSKVPLPNYRADLDEHHGSTKQEVKHHICVLQTLIMFLLVITYYTQLQIRMSSEIETKVGQLLNDSQVGIPVDKSSSTSSHTPKGSSNVLELAKPPHMSETDASNEKLSLELKRRQEELRVLFSC